MDLSAQLRTLASELAGREAVELDEDGWLVIRNPYTGEIVAHLPPKNPLPDPGPPPQEV